MADAVAVKPGWQSSETHLAAFNQAVGAAMVALGALIPFVAATPVSAYVQVALIVCGAAKAVVAQVTQMQSRTTIKAPPVIVTPDGKPLDMSHDQEGNSLPPFTAEPAK